MLENLLKKTSANLQEIVGKNSKEMRKNLKKGLRLKLKEKSRKEFKENFWIELRQKSSEEFWNAF